MRVLFAALLTLASGLAAAQEPDAGEVVCDAPPVRGPAFVTPSVGARLVTTDAEIRVQYNPGYFEAGGGDPTTLISVQRCPSLGCDLTSCVEDGVFVPGLVQVLGDTLVFIPDDPWDSEQAYSGIARGIDIDLPFQFCTGTTTDTSAPMIGALEPVTSTAVDVRCDAPEGGFRIGVFFPPADDPGGPPGSIEYLLFQTRGAGLEEPLLRARARNVGATSQVTMAFNLPPSEASSVICVRVAAVDGVGNVAWSESNPGNDCVDPVQGNFFYGLCSVSAASATSISWIGIAALGCMALALVLLLRRR